MMLWSLFLACSGRAPVELPPMDVPAPGFRIAFGSCVHQSLPQPALMAAAAMKPDLFIWLGDNIYGDTTNMETLARKYQKQGARTEFQTLWSQAGAVRAVWDDHDYGSNDAGREYPFRAESEALFLDFWQVPADSDRRQHPGIYGTEMFHDGAHSVQLILLDTRYFRDPPLHHERGDGFKNDYRPHETAEATYLGDAQWAWLDTVLQQPATIRIVASSTQFGHSYNGWESWTNFPHEQAKMVSLLREHNANNTLFVSGDVHWGEISRYTPDDGPPIYDVTSSGINQVWPTTEPNDNRVGDVVRVNNFGVIDIDWQGQNIHLQLRDKLGKVVEQTTVSFSEIGVQIP